MKATVLLFATAPDRPEAVTGAYHEISRALAGTPGLLRNALLQDAGEPGRFVVLSEWSSLTEFRAWEEGTAHRRITAPLREYHTGFGIYHVAAEY